MTTSILAPMSSEETALAPRVLLESAPAAVLAEAALAAKALKTVLDQKVRKVVMNDEQYLEFEDWQTLGRFYGITAREDGDPEFVSLGEIHGFKASALAVDRDGRELSRATAYCLNDEEKWSSRAKYAWAYVLKSGGTSEDDPGPENMVWEDNPSKPGKSRPKKVREQVGEEKVPLFQLSSMAQTRAAAKALRNVLSWVAVLAGYRPTPAEEMDGVIPTAPKVAERDPGSDDVEDATPAHPQPTAKPTNGGPKVPCPQCGKPAGASRFPKEGKTLYCFACKFPFAPAVQR